MNLSLLLASILWIGLDAASSAWEMYDIEQSAEWTGRHHTCQVSLYKAAVDKPQKPYPKKPENPHPSGTPQYRAWTIGFLSGYHTGLGRPSIPSPTAFERGKRVGQNHARRGKEYSLELNPFEEDINAEDYMLDDDPDGNNPNALWKSGYKEGFYGEKGWNIPWNESMIRG